MAAAVVDAVSAPRDYDQFAHDWAGYILGFVAKLGVPWQEAPDVAQDIILALISADIIGQFNPGHHIEHDGARVRAKWKAFLNRHVETRVRGKRDALARRRRREALIMDKPISADGESTWADLLCGVVDDQLAAVVAEPIGDLTGRLRKLLETVPRRSSRDLCDLPIVFDCVLEGVVLTGEVDYEVIQKRFGISSTAARSWVNRLRDVLVTELKEVEPS